MKQLLSTMILLMFALYVQAQQKTYLTFDPSCMDRLEYRYSEQNSGMSILSYTVKPSSEDLYLLDIGAESIKVQRNAPKGLVNCSKLSFSEPKITRYNNGKERLYIVRRTSDGYIVTPVGAVTKISKKADTYTFVGPGYRFALNENPSSVTMDNIGQAGTIAFFKEKKVDYCIPVYTVTREPDEVCTVKTDYAFMPGVGFVGERTGLTEGEKKKNALYLYRVNGMPAKDYIESICPGRERQVAPAPETYAKKDDPVGDKEQVARQAPPAVATPYVQKDASAPAAPNAPVAPKCKELQGEGYHIVQPRESLGAIARVYGVKMQNVVSWNKIPDPNHIEICQKLWLMPPPADVTVAPAPAPGKKKAATKTAAAPPPTIQRQWNTPNSAPATAQQPATYAYTAPQSATIGTAKKPNATPEQYGQSSTIGAVQRQAPLVGVQNPMPASQNPTIGTVQRQAPAATAAPVPEQYGQHTAIGAVQPQVPAAPTTNGAVMPTERTRVPTNINATTETNPFSGQAAKPTAPAAPIQPAAMAPKPPKPQSYAYTGVKGVGPNEEVFGTQIVHVVQKGETWFSIAQQYGYTVDRFTRLNGLESSEVLKPGMKLLTTDCTCPNPSLYLEKNAINVAASTSAVPTTVAPATSSAVFQETAVAGKNGSRVTYAPSEATPKNVVTTVAPVVYSNNVAATAPLATETTSGILKTHIVKNGETIYAIAEAYHLSLSDLLQWNNLENNDVLFPGKTIIVGR